MGVNLSWGYPHWQHSRQMKFHCATCQGVFTHIFVFIVATLNTICVRRHYNKGLFIRRSSTNLFFKLFFDFYINFFQNVRTTHVCCSENIERVCVWCYMHLVLKLKRNSYLGQTREMPLAYECNHLWSTREYNIFSHHYFISNATGAQPIIADNIINFGDGSINIDYGRRHYITRPAKHYYQNM